MRKSKLDTHGGEPFPFCPLKLRTKLDKRLPFTAHRAPYVIFGVTATNSRERKRNRSYRSFVPLIFSPTTLVSPSHSGETSLLDSGMALNQAQLLVHDDEALARFRVDHKIPDDVVIERLGPNDDADWVEGEGNRIPIRTWFMHQAGLRFPLSKLLKTVLSLCGLTFMQVLVNFVRTVLAVEALMQREGQEFTAKDLLHVYCVVKPRKNSETRMLEGNHYPTSFSITTTNSRERKRNRSYRSFVPLIFSPTTLVSPSHSGETSLLDSGMAVNQAQLLVHDDEALARFRVDHKIPDDVVIERLGPNDDADWVEGECNRIPIRTWFIHQAGLRFPLSKLLKTVLSLCGLTFMQVLVNFVRTVLAVEALMQREGLEFTAEDLLHVYCVVKPRRPRCLKVRGQAPRPRSSLSDEVSDLFEGTSVKLRRLLEEAEGESSDSSESSSSSWDVDLGDEGLDEKAEVEDSEEVDQVPAAAPLVLVPNLIILPSSDSDITIVKLREVVEHSYTHSDSSSSGSRGNEEAMAPKVRILGKGQAPRIELARFPKVPDSSIPISNEDQSVAPSSMAGGKRKGKQPTEGTSRQKRRKGAGSRDLRRAGQCRDAPTRCCGSRRRDHGRVRGKLVMLGAQRAVSTSLLLKQGAMDLNKANQKANSLEKELKQTKAELADARSTAEIATLQRNQAQQEASDLKAFACGARYIKSYLTMPSSELARDPPASPERYSPIILPDFNEEEYATLPADGGNVNIAMAEAHADIEGTIDGDRDGQLEGDRDGEAEGENLV
ncbi:hypothetical protein Acr_10g0000790 [Actinidia rufa]|uniref:Uncharacterized protein n=1 Tax=Actinidia rufa TaxID=165716 RepID=A0A7J0F7M1_9ERIC|nr:hypothetical protein Acr_10g0000790 [Actinidia rufa]